MSWNASVQAVKPEDFDEAVDGCAVSPAEDGLADEPKAQLDAARAAAKELAGVIGVHTGEDDGKLLTASLSGHACGEGESGLDSINVSLRQVAGAGEPGA